MSAWVAECPYCGVAIEGATEREAVQRRIDHIFGPCDDDRPIRWDTDLEDAYQPD